MTISQLTLVYVSVGATLAGTLIGGYIAHRLSLEKMAHDIRSEANRKLRTAFSEELAILQRQRMSGVEIIRLLDSAFLKHQIAVNEFRSHLAEGELIAFNNAWVKYHGYQEGGEVHDIQFFEKYSFHNNKADQDKASKDIKALLEFAKPPVINPIIRSKRT
ncbi:hypothetical protein [uncultured Endozoicomonas sp.]|uniref:hypothetical protein n=1 Tax=uncultured Endozoicomonas sp. TaxID=432652 RepID=UPI00261B50FA|nr:hypothetical protein [uncultured Endozoicomonas sp.]